MARRNTTALSLIVAAGMVGALLLGCDQTGSGAHMMGGSMMGGGMMGRTPSDEGEQTLPEAQSPGARLIQSYCGRCHAPPSPTVHSAQEWPGVVERMKGHMVTQGMTLPEHEQLREIINYLQRHAG